VLAFGRQSGWKTYYHPRTNMERGSRIIELHEGEFVFDTWISTTKGIEQAVRVENGVLKIEN
jgi:hypothetical protein